MASAFSFNDVTIFYSEKMLMNNVTLTLSDGARLVNDTHFWASASAGLRSFTLDFLFHGPVAVEDIASITLFGRELSLE